MTGGWPLRAALVAVLGAGAACADTAVDRSAASPAQGPATSGADRALDATKDAAASGADSAKAMAAEAADKGQALAVAAGASVTDAWITAKVKAKLADETLLNSSDFQVETTAHVVTLGGRVPTSAAKARAVEIAGGTERVVRVVDHLVVSR